MKEFPADRYPFDEDEVRRFEKDNPWFTEQWFKQNREKLENYFDCELTFEQAKLGIMQEPRIDWFLDYLGSRLAFTYDSSVQSN